jgi:hypothetical protein
LHTINQIDDFAAIKKAFFEIVKIQTDDTLMKENKQFADLKENELQKAKITFKNREKLIKINSIKFNNEIISKNDQDLLLSQFKQFDQIKLINLSFSVDLISSRNQIRKSMIFKNQHVTQRVRNAYIVTLFQSKASFDFFVVVQIINSKEKDVKKLNKRFQ